MRALIKIVCLLLTVQMAGAQVVSVRGIGGALFRKTATVSYLLDNLTTAPASAYSLRKLRAGYTGAAIRVRRSSDNTESDIGFTAGGVLNQTALLSFVGSGSGFVSVWYDQKGTTNLIQANTGIQPRIVNAGAVVLANSVPTVEGLNASNTYMDAAYSNTGTTIYLASVFNMRSPTNTYGRLFSLGVNGANDYGDTRYMIGLVRNAGSANYNANRNGDFGGNGTLNTLTTHAVGFSGSGGTLSLNGTQTATSPTTGNFAINLFRLFCHTANTVETWDGVCSEIILFSSYPAAADQNAIQASQKTFYATP